MNAGRFAERVAGGWNDVAWPVLAGASTAVGLLGLSSTYGLLGLTLISAGLWVFGAVTVYGVLSESGVGLGSRGSGTAPERRIEGGPRRDRRGGDAGPGNRPIAHARRPRGGGPRSRYRSLTDRPPA